MAARIYAADSWRHGAQTRGCPSVATQRLQRMIVCTFAMQRAETAAF